MKFTITKKKGKEDGSVSDKEDKECCPQKMFEIDSSNEKYEYESEIDMSDEEYENDKIDHNYVNDVKLEDVDAETSSYTH